MEASKCDVPTGEPAPGSARVRLEIRASGKPSGVRLRVTDSAGTYFPPLGHLPVPTVGSARDVGDLILGDGETHPFELHALVYDGAEIDLPLGRYVFVASKGFEYQAVRQEAEITLGGNQTIRLALEKFVDFEALGWYPGDTHLHFPDPQGVRYEMECEGLRVCSLLLLKNGLPNPPRPGDGTFWNVNYFTGDLSPVSDAEHFVKVGEEFRHGLLAHLVLQNLHSIVWPVSTGGLRESGLGGNDWPLMYHVAGDAASQGALVSWAHWPYPSLEAPLDIALGRIDSLDLLTTGDPFEHHPELVSIYKMFGPRVYSIPPIEVYYHYLNCGFRLAASAGSDKMGLNPPIGSARTYVRTDAPLSYDTWVNGIRSGRTFVSTYPLLEFTVDGNGPGDTLLVRPGRKRLSLDARALSLQPYEQLEIVYNGEVVRQAEPTGPHHESALHETLEIDRGGWLAARVHGRTMLPYGRTYWRMPVFAHTSPVYVQMPGRPAPAACSAELFLDQLSWLRIWIESQASFALPEQRQQALGLVDRARAIYEGLAETPDA